jgi:glycosyltransferase involved in cell wall biosynthesis
MDPQLPISLAPDPRLQIIRRKNAGPSAARNTGLDACPDADSVILLDHDDRLIPAGVAAMIRLAESTNAAGAVAARIEVLDDGTRRPKPVPDEWADRILPSPELVFVPKQWFAGTGILITRRGLSTRFDESLAVVEDRDFLRELAKAGPIAVCSTPAIEYTIRAGASNLSSAKHAATRIRGHIRILEKHWSPEADAPLRDATIWLINAAAKWRVDPPTWAALTAAARSRGWPIPLKARLRRVFSR